MNHGRNTNDNGANDNGGENARAKARAVLKLWGATILATECLSAIFSCVVDRIDASATSLPTLMFTCATSALVSRWLVIDAGRAWAHACERGYVRRREQTVEVAQDCPKRWLVVLHAGLNPQLAVKR